MIRSPGRAPRPFLPFRRCDLLIPVLVAALLGSPAAVGAADVEDLLWDLQIVPLDGRAAPGFAIEDLDGGTVSLADLKGRAVLLYFWTST